MGFRDLPEAHKLCFLNRTVVVCVNLIEEFLSRELCKLALPVIQGLFPVDLLTAVDVEYGESFHHFRLHSLREFLALDLLAFASSCAHL